MSITASLLAETLKWRKINSFTGWCSTRLKKQSYQKIYANNYFWRTWDQKETDWVEEREGKLFGFEFKWGKDKVKPPKDFLEAYPNATFAVIDQENYLDFVS